MRNNKMLTITTVFIITSIIITTLYYKNNLLFMERINNAVKVSNQQINVENDPFQYLLFLV